MIFVEFEKIQKILSNQLGMEVENIQPESTFVEDLGELIKAKVGSEE